MSVLQTQENNIQVMQGLHGYHFFMSNCAQRVNLALAEKELDRDSASV